MAKVQIHKPKVTTQFVQVDADNWQYAFTHLSQAAFGIYLLCATCEDGYAYELNYQYCMNKLQISKTSFYRALQELEIQGFISNGHFYVRSLNQEKELNELKSRERAKFGI